MWLSAVEYVSLFDTACVCKFDAAAAEAASQQARQARALGLLRELASGGGGLTAEVFGRLDVNGDGYLSRDELAAGMPALLGGREVTNETVGLLMETLDTDKDGRVSWSELAALSSVVSEIDQLRAELVDIAN